MPTVVFETALHVEREPAPAWRRSRAHAPPAPLTVAVPEGGALADVCDDARAPVPFSCRGANCGTCLIEVLEGASELTAPDAEEMRILELFDAPPSQRLACCVQMRPGLAVIRIRAVNAVPADRGTNDTE